jgi:hypothetical protein
MSSGENQAAVPATQPAAEAAQQTPVVETPKKAPRKKAKPRAPKTPKKGNRASSEEPERETTKKGKSSRSVLRFLTLLLGVVKAIADDYETTYDDLDWYDENYDKNAVKAPELIQSGTAWEKAMREAKSDIAKHPIGLHLLEVHRMRDNEPMMAAYLQFDSVQHYRQWLLVDGTSLPD